MLKEQRTQKKSNLIPGTSRDPLARGLTRIRTLVLSLLRIVALMVLTPARAIAGIIAHCKFNTIKKPVALMLSLLLIVTLVPSLATADTSTGTQAALPTVSDLTAARTSVVTGNFTFTYNAPAVAAEATDPTADGTTNPDDPTATAGADLTPAPGRYYYVVLPADDTTLGEDSAATDIKSYTGDHTGSGVANPGVNEDLPLALPAEDQDLTLYLAAEDVAGNLSANIATYALAKFDTSATDENTDTAIDTQSADIAPLAAVNPTAALTNVTSFPAFTINATTNAISYAGQQWLVIGKNISEQSGTGGVNSGTENTLTLLLSDKGGTFSASSAGPYGGSAFRSSGGGTDYSGTLYANNPNNIGGVDTSTAWTYPNEYKGSTLHQKMYDLYNSTGGFLAKEKTRIVTRELPLTTGYSTDSSYPLTKTVVGQYLWPLSIGELYNAVQTNGSATPASRFGGSGYVWLRSPRSTSSSSAMEGYGSGSGYTYYSVSGGRGVRPAFTLNLASVIFTSVASGASSPDSLSPQNYVNITSAWSAVADPKKFTFSDSGLTFTLSNTADKSATNVSGATLNLGAYTGATSGKRISALLINKSIGGSYYENLVTSSSSSGSDLTLNTSGMAVGTYTLKVFTEELGGTDKSNFCSVPQTINTVTITDAPVYSSDANITQIFGNAVTWGGGNGASGTPKTTTVAVESNVSEITTGAFTKSDSKATLTLHTTNAYSGGESSIALNAGNNTIYVKVVAEDGTTSLYYSVTVNRKVSYTVSQIGGTDETVNTTGIAITFTPAVLNLTAGSITLAGTGSPAGVATKGTPTGSGTSWTLPITVTSPGDLNVSIANFGGYTVAGSPKSVTVYQKAVRALTVSPASINFGSAAYGYSPLATQSITITNTGNRSTTISSIAVSGTDFTITTTTAVIAAGASVTRAIQPKTGLTVGNKATTITVTYTSTDGQTTNPSATATAAATFAVTKNTAPSYTIPGPFTITYAPDQTLGASGINLGTGFAWTNSGTLVGDAGQGKTFTVIFTPTDTNNYASVAGINVTVNVNKATPAAVTDYDVPTNLTATVGQTLGAISLAGYSQTKGTFEWDTSQNPTSTALNTRGQYTYKLKFIPNATYSGNYNTAYNISVTVTVKSGDASLTTVAGIKIDSWGGSGTSGSPYTGSISVPSTMASISADNDIKPTSTAAGITLYGSTGFEGNAAASVALSAGDQYIYIKVVAENGTESYYRVTVKRQVSYIVEQDGGANETADTTRIKITFTPAVTGLAVNDITLTNGTGAAIRGDTLSGSETIWYINLSSVTSPGSVNVAIANFNSYTVAGSPKSAIIYQKATRTVTTAAVDLGSKVAGYDSADSAYVRVTNSGNRATTIASVTVGNSDFTITGGSNVVLPANTLNSTTWTISPKTGLAAGVHTAVITVNYTSTDGGDTNTSATATAAATFTVLRTAPVVTGYAPSVQGKNDGYITGTDTTMEYQMSGGGSWVGCINNTITGLAPGTYYVRYVEAGGHPASANATVVIGNGTAQSLTVTVTPPAFASAQYSLTPPAAGDISIKNSGNWDATIKSVTLTGTSASAFSLTSSGSIVALTAGAVNTTWKLRPVANLHVGTYTATINVSYAGITGYTGTAAPVTTDVSFTVSKYTPVLGTDYSTPSALTAVVGQTLGAIESQLSAQMTDRGTFSWDANQNPTTTSVGEPGQHTFYAKFTKTPNSGHDDYNVVTGIAVTVNVRSNTADLTTVAGIAISATGTGSQSSPKTASINVLNSKASIDKSEIDVSAGAAAELYSNADFNANKDANISLTAGGTTHLYIKVIPESGETDAVYYDVSVFRPYPTVTFSAIQVGGTYEEVNTTGIAFTFNRAVSNLTDGAITITDGTGKVVKGTSVTGSSTVWTINVTNVTSPGAVNVSIRDFGEFLVNSAGSTSSVDVYQKATRALTAADISFDAATYGAINTPAQPITITNTGNRTATITSITANPADFNITSGATSVSAYGGTNTAWQIAPKTNLSAGPHNAIITVTYNGTDGNTTATAAAVVYVNKANPVYTTPSGLTVTYAPNLQLSAVSLSDHPGFTWKTPGETVGYAGDKTFKATFTPSTENGYVGGTDNYNVIDNIDVIVHVDKAEPSYESYLPTNLTAIVGQPLSTITETQLNANNTATDRLDYGIFSWETADSTTVPNLGANTGFTLKYTPTDTTNYTTAGNISVTVTGLSAPTITNDSTNLSNGQVGVSYTNTNILTAAGTLPITWDIVTQSALNSGETAGLPTGVVLNANDTFTGTPSAFGTFKFGVRATNSVGSDTEDFTLIVTKPTEITTAQSALDAKFAIKGEPYTTTYEGGFTFTGVGYYADSDINKRGNITWEQKTPATDETTLSSIGMSLSEDGKLTGTPTADGTYRFTVVANNGVGLDAEQQFTLNIYEPVTISPTAINLPVGTVGKPYDAPFSGLLTSSGTAPISWSAIGLPEGLSLNGESIVGQPTSGTANTYTVTLTADNAAGRPTSAAFSLTVNDLPVISDVSVTRTGHTSASAVFKSSEFGTYFYLINDSASPVAAETIADANHSGNVTSKNAVTTISALAGLTSGAHYLHIVVRNGSGHYGSEAIEPIAGYDSNPPTVTAGAIEDAVDRTGDTTATIKFNVAKISEGGASPATINKYYYAISAQQDLYSSAADVKNAALNQTTIVGDSGTAQAGENIITDTALKGLTAGLRYIFIVADDTNGNLSQILKLSIKVYDVTPPTLTLIDVERTGSATAIVQFKNDETSTYYYIVTTAAVTSNTAVKNGGGAGKQLNANTPETISLTDLAPGQTHIYIVAEDPNPNLSAILTLDIPAWTEPVQPLINGNPPSGKLTQSYNYTFTATGAPEPLKWEQAGDLPPGLTFTAGGDGRTASLAGTPSQTGSYTFTLTVTNTRHKPADELSISRTFTVNIEQAPVITTTSLPGATVGKAYSQRLEATGIPAPTWSITGGSLPSGLRLDGDTITGTPTTATSGRNFTVRASNAAGTAEQLLTIVVTAAPVLSAGTATRTDATTATVTFTSNKTGTRYYLVDTNPSADAASITGNIDPADAGSNTINLTNLTSGAKYIHIIVKDSADNASSVLSINIPKEGTTIPEVTPPQTAADTVNRTSHETATVTFTSTKTGTYYYIVDAAQTANAADVRTGGQSSSAAIGENIITNPVGLTAGTKYIHIVVEDADGNLSAVLDITIPAYKQAPDIITESLPDANVGGPYSRQLVSSGTPAPTWSITGGSLPPGLILDGDTIKGTPTTAGEFEFTVKATNMAGSDTQGLSITVNEAPVLSAGTATRAGAGTAIVTFTSNKAGKSYYVVNGVSSADADNITAHEADAVAGSNTINLADLDSGAKYIHIIVKSGSLTSDVLSINIPAYQDPPPTLSQGTANRTGHELATVTFTSNEAGTYYYVVDGVATANAADLRTDGQSGPASATSNTITNPIGLTAGDKYIHIIVEDEAGGLSAVLNIAIPAYTQAPVISTESLPGGVVGKAYSQRLEATGIPTPAWSIVGGSLPAGLTLDGDTITGTPTTATAGRNFTVRATNAAGTADQLLTIAVTAAPVLSAGTATRESATTATVTFTSSKAGTRYYLVNENSLTNAADITANNEGAVAGQNTVALTGLTSGAKYIHIIVKDSANNTSRVLSINIPAEGADIPVVSPPSIAAEAVDRTGHETATVKFRSNKDGIYYYIVDGARTANAADVRNGGQSGTANAGEITIENPVGLTAGAKYIHIAIEDAAGNLSAVLDIEIPAYKQAPEIITNALPGANVGKPYSQRLEATGTPTPAWTIASGSLPAGLRLDGDTITGTPTTAETASFTVKATNTAGDATQSLTIVVTAAPVLSAGTATRTDANNATVTFTSSKAGQRTYLVDTNPSADVASITENTEAVNAGSNMITLSNLTSGAKYIHIIVRDGGLTSDVLTINIPAEGADIPVVSPPSIAAEAVDRTGHETATVKFTSDKAGSYYYIVDAIAQANAADVRAAGTQGTASASEENIITNPVGLTAGARYIHIIVDDGAGNLSAVLNIAIPAYTQMPAILTESLPDANVGKAYSQRLEATGIPTPAWTVASGTLPAGLTLDGDTITGTPQVAVNTAFTVRATNAAGYAEQALTISVTAVPVLSAGTATRTDATTATVTFTSSKAGTRYYLINGVSSADAADITANNEGAVAGQNTVALTGLTSGAKYIHIIVKDSADNTSRVLSINIPKEGTTIPEVTPPQTAAEAVDRTGHETATVKFRSNKDGIYYYIVDGAQTANAADVRTASQSGSAKDGENIITNPLGLTAGAKYIHIVVEDTDGNLSAVLDIEIPAYMQAPEIITNALPGANVGKPYSQRLEATGTPTPAWTIASGSLPAGLRLDGDTITGTPTTAETASFTVKATNTAGDATQSLTIVVTAAPVLSAGTATRTDANNATVTFTSSKAGQRTYLVDTNPSADVASITENTEAANAGSNTITLSNLTSGAKYIHIIVRDGDLTSDVLSINIPAENNPVPTLSAGTADRTGDETATVNFTSSEDGTYYYIVDGVAQANAADVRNGGHSGTASASVNTITNPTGLTAGAKYIHIIVEDAAGGLSTVLSVPIPAYTAPVPPMINGNINLPDGTVNVVYTTYTFTAEGTEPITWTITGDLPDGLSFNAAAATISGTPAAIGTFEFTVVATNVAKATARTFTITIADQTYEQAPVITTTSLPGATVGVPYSQQLVATGTPAPTWSIESGSLPAGLTLAGGTIAGTPTAIGTSNFTVRATNTAGNATQSLSITVTAVPVPPSIEGNSHLPGGKVGTAYTHTFTATGTKPITWAITGDLPGGLSFDAAAAKISGTPTQSGAFTFTVTATNTVNTAERTFTITITQAPQITTTSLPDGAVGAAYSNALSATGYPASTWSIANGKLPFGLTLNASTGAITGTPTGAGLYTFTARASNGTAPNAEKALSIWISPEDENLPNPLDPDNPSNPNDPDSPYFDLPGGGGYVEDPETGVPNINNPEYPGYNEPGGGGYVEDPSTGVPNINNPDYPGYNEPGGGGYKDPETGIPNINNPDYPGYNEPGGGGYKDPETGIPNINNPEYPGYNEPGGGGYVEDPSTGVPNINDPTSPSYNLPGGGGADDDKDGIPNINDPDSPNYWLPGGGGVTGGNIYRVITHFGKWSGKGSLAARIDADYNKFVALYYSGAKVDRANYTVTEGSTIITLTERYLKTFPDGKYTFIATFSDGYSAEILLEIDLKGGTSKTGDDSGIGMSILTLLFATAGLTGCVITRRRLRKYHIGAKA